MNDDNDDDNKKKGTRTTEDDEDVEEDDENLINGGHHLFQSEVQLRAAQRELELNRAKVQEHENMRDHYQELNERLLKQQQDIERLHNERRNLIMGIAQKNIETENEYIIRLYY